MSQFGSDNQQQICFSSHIHKKTLYMEVNQHSNASTSYKLQNLIFKLHIPEILFRLKQTFLTERKNPNVNNEKSSQKRQLNFSLLNVLFFLLMVGFSYVASEVHKDQLVGVVAKMQTDKPIDSQAFDLHEQMEDHQDLSIHRRSSILNRSDNENHLPMNYNETQRPKLDKSIENPQERSLNFYMEMQKEQKLFLKEIQRTYSLMKEEIIKIQEIIIKNNSQAITQAKEFNIKNQYESFQQKIQEVDTRKQSTIQLKLFPILDKWATSPRNMTFLEQFKLKWMSFMTKKVDEWRELHDMLRNQGLWQSSGRMLTVGTFSTKIDDDFSLLQLFIPTVFTFEFPYNIPENEIVQIYGLRMKRDTYTNVQTPIFKEYLGEIKVAITQEEHQRKRPVKRIFYCEEIICNKFYSLIKIVSTSNLKLYSYKIESIMTLGGEK